MSGNVVVIGAVWNDTAALNSGSAYVYYLSSSVPFRPVLTIPNPSADEQDYFGNGIAIDGPRLAVAAESDDTAAYDSGIVHVFDLSRSLASTPVLSITHPAPKSGDIFGSSVALAGSVLVVGALRDDTGTEEAGAAYVYDLAGSSPRVPILTLTNPTPGFVDYFGKVAAFGRRILVSASLDDTLGENAGIAYVYDLDSATPAIPVTTLSSPRPAAKDVFGVSLGFDGVRAIIGAAQSIPFQEGAGAAYIFGQPILSVARSDAGIANVSWIPTNAADFTLQFADSLPATNWSDYPTQTNPLRAEATNRFQLFRLIDRTLSRKPQTLR
jgi:hypothetical protein